MATKKLFYNELRDPANLTYNWDHSKSVDDNFAASNAFMQDRLAKDKAQGLVTFDMYKDLDDNALAKKVTDAFDKQTFGQYNAEDVLKTTQAIKGFDDDWSTPITEDNPLFHLSQDASGLLKHIQGTPSGSSALKIVNENPALLMGEHRNAIGNFGGDTAIGLANKNASTYITPDNESGFTDQYQKDIDAGLGGQFNEHNLGGRLTEDGTALRPESIEYNKSGNFVAPDGISSYQPYSGPFATSHNPNSFIIPENSTLGTAGDVFITDPKKDAFGNPITNTPPLDGTPPLGGGMSMTPPVGGGDTTTQGGDTSATDTDTKSGMFGGSFEDFFKFMMLMNMMGGGGFGGRGGYGGSQYGYGGLNPGGVMSAYNPMDDFNSYMDGFKSLSTNLANL